ncbi:MAG: hypothetical protein KA783_09005 [Chitinophagales bacterium]|jgi:hypothetical protein|nr:hypothetical protein [Chitinophagales bacterium]
MVHLPKHPIDLGILGETYAITRRDDCQHLTTWLAAQYTLDEVETAVFERLYETKKNLINYYNEEELKIELISLVFFLANVDIASKVKVFYERPLKAIVGNYQLSVIADCLVATPTSFNRPKNPYFFLQEFKKGKGDDKDPEAQMLAAMLIAQQQNNNQQPLYGSFVIGAHWHFTTLVEKQYCLSRSFDATNYKDLKQIVFILRKIKDFAL